MSTLALLAALGGLPTSAQAICTFTSDLDPGANSFRSCVEAANAGTFGTVQSGLAADATVELQNPVDITRNVTLGGGGSPTFLWDGDSNGWGGIFKLAASRELTIGDEMTVRSGGDGTSAVEMTGSFSNVYLYGTITTEGDNAPGVRLNDGNNLVAVQVGATLSTTGANSHGIWAGGPSGINNVYVGGTVSATGAGANAIQFTTGRNHLQLWAGYSITGNVVGMGDDILSFGEDDDASFDLSRLETQYTGFGSIRKNGDSVWTVTGDGSAYSGETFVDEGQLNVTGSLGGATTVEANAILSGTGSLGAVTIASWGIVLPGTSPGTLTMDSLVLENNSILGFELGTPGVAAVSDLIKVTGDLTLDGVLYVNDAGGFGNGVYTLIEYGNLVADNGVDFGTMPAGFTYAIDAGTGTASAVTLEVAGGASGSNQYWDGANTTPGGTLYGRGGAGTWTAAGTNWTDTAGSTNGVWGSQFAVFYNGTGDVTVDGAQNVNGLQFAADGYRLVEAAGGGSLFLTNQISGVRVDTGRTATLDLPVTARALYKTGAGTLQLTGEVDVIGGPLAGGGTYAGDLSVQDGLLRIIDGATVGADRAFVSHGARLEVDGAGTTLTTHPGADLSLNVGTDGNGEFAITGGAVVTSGPSDVGANATDIPGGTGLASYEGKATVSGPGSTWNASQLDVGTRGGDGDLTISDGGIVSGQAGSIGYGSMSSPSFGSRSSTGQVTIDGAGSAWMLSDQLRIGVLGGSGTLALTDGGVVEKSGAATGLIGHGEDSHGNLMISGAGSELRVLQGGLQLGVDSGTGEILVTDGGHLDVNGHIDVSTVGTLTHITPVGGLKIGGNEGTATLTVINGGRVTAGLMMVGDYYTTGPSTASIVLDGPGSEIVVNENLEMRIGGSFTVSGGARLHTFAASALGVEHHQETVAADRIGMGISRSTMTVTGAGSLWQSDNAIRVHAIGTINVEDGATVYGTGGVLIGFGRVVDLAEPAAILTVDDARLVTDWDLDIGNGGAWAEVTFRNGATVETRGVTVGTGGTNRNGVTYLPEVDILVIGSGTSWTDSSLPDGIFSVGGTGVTTLTVTDGAVIETKNRTIFGRGAHFEGRVDVTVSDGGRFSTLAAITLGDEANGTGTLTVTGAGSLVEAGDVLEIGTAGRGEVTVTDNGLVTASHIHVGRSGGSGLLTIGTGEAAGRVNAGGSDLHSGELILGSSGILGLGGAGGGDLTVHDGGRLGGTGTIDGNLAMALGGIVAPGHSIGTLAVTGDVAFAAGSIYDVEIAASGDADLLAASGSATLDGGTVQVTALDPFRSYQDGQSYVILTADGGVTGEFAEAAMLNHSAFITPSLIHNPDNVTLTIEVTRDFTMVANSFNQRQAAGGLFGLDQTPGSDALTAFNTIAVMDDSTARGAFDLSSGEIHASAQHVIGQTSSLFNRTLRYQGLAGVGAGNVGVAVVGSTAATPATDGPASAKSSPRGGWGAPLGGFGQLDGDGNAGELDWWNAGLAGGYEGAIDAGSGQAVLGFGFAYIRSHGSIDDRLAELDSDGFYLGAYGAWTQGPWRVAGALSYGANRVSTERNIPFVGREAEADYWTHGVDLSGEASYAVELGDATRLAPLVTVDAGWAGHGRFTEEGAGALNLTGASENWTRFDTGLGLALTHMVTTSSGKVMLEGRTVWEHAFADRVLNQALSLAGSAVGFSVHGPVAGRDRLRLGAGAAWDIAGDMTIRVRYDGLLSGEQADHTGSFGLMMRF